MNCTLGGSNLSEARVGGLRLSRRLVARAACALALCALTGCTSATGHSNMLWVLVDAGCNERLAPPVPSLTCHPKRAEALLKDRCGQTHYLLIPTARRIGVESPELLRDDEPNYFSDAWAARDRAIAASGRSGAGSDELGLAINSRWGRTQDQLHIHIDFVRPQVRTAIAQWRSGGMQSPQIELFGHVYRIEHVADLGHPTPFQRAAGPEDSAERRAANTIAVVGDGGAGFYLLFGRADPLRLDRGHAEEILIPKVCGN